MEGGSEGEKKKTPEGEPKTKRKMKTASQLEILEKTYAVETYPGESLRAELSAKLGLSDRQLQMWFCHRRLKDRKPPSAKRARKDSSAPSTAVAGSTPLAVGPVGDEMGIGEVGIEHGSGSGSGSSPFRHMESWRFAAPRPGSAVARIGADVPAMMRYYEPPPLPQQSVVELRAISFVEAQLGEPLREDGPILGMEFDPLPPDAFGALIVPAGQQKQTGRPYEAKLYERSDSKSNKGTARGGPHEYQFLPEQPAVRTDSYERVTPSHYYGSSVDGSAARASTLSSGRTFMHGSEQVPSAYGFQYPVPSFNILPQQSRQGHLLSSSAGEYDAISRKDVFTNITMDAHFGSHPINALEIVPSERVPHEDDASRMERKRKSEEARIAREVEAHEKRIRKELEKQDILRRKREEQIRKEMERHDRERRKEEERLLREKHREEERYLREQRRELERREKFLQKESIRAEKMRQKEEQRREKEAAKLKAANDRAIARKIAKESMELIEDERLELMELAASSKGLPSILSLDSETLQNLESFRDALTPFPPNSVRLKRPFSFKPWSHSDVNVGNLLMVWRFLITFADVLGLWPFTVDEFVQAFHDYDPRLLNEIHVALLRSIIKDIEDVARTPSTGLGGNPNSAASPSGGHPLIVEGAYAWGFDIRSWQHHLNPLTWPEILRQFALSAGLGPQVKKRSIEQAFVRDENDDNDGEDIISNLRNGVAAENALSIMQERGFSNPRRSRHRLTPGTVKFAAFHVLSLEGSNGLTILEVAERIQKSGLRDLTTSKTPEASIAAALSRDVKLFERTAPSTYCVRTPYRKDPVDAEEILSAAREKIQIFKNGFSDGEEADDVERDEDSESDVAEDPEVDDLDPESNAKKETQPYETDAFEVKTPLTNGNEAICNEPVGTPLSGVLANASDDFFQLRSDGFNEPMSCGASTDRCVDGAGILKDTSNPDEEETDIDESNPGEPWVQGLMEGEYSDLSVEERLNALTTLIGVVIEGNSIRVVLEERLEAANALKKQMWAEAQLDKRRMKEEYVTKMQYSYFMGNKIEQNPNLSEGRQSPFLVEEKSSEAPVILPTQQGPFTDPHNDNYPNTLATDRNLPIQEYSTAPEHLTVQLSGPFAEKSRSQIKSYIGHKAEEMYVYRSLPLGQDRRRNRYWQFVTSASHNDPGCGRIFVELHDGFWRLIDSEEGFDGLLTSLDVRGVRESHLHMMLQKIEMSFKETLRRNSHRTSESQSIDTLKSEASEAGHLPDPSFDIDSPSSMVCVSNFDTSEPSPSFSVELGRNEAEKRNAVNKYHDFEKWMWQECFNSLILGGMKYGKKRCAPLLVFCDNCHDVYFLEDNQCPAGCQPYGTFTSNSSERVEQMKEKLMADFECSLHQSESSLPLRVKLLKAQLSLVEVCVLPEALQPVWTESYRKSWGLKLHAASSSENLFQILTMLEHAIKRDFLSLEFETTKELLKSCNLSASAEDYPSHEAGPVLPWVPHTTAAVALRLMELDASIFYLLSQKEESQKDRRAGDFFKFPSRYAVTKNSQDDEQAVVSHDVEYLREENWVEPGGTGHLSSGRGRGGRGRGRGRSIRGGKSQRRIPFSQPDSNIRGTGSSSGRLSQGLAWKGGRSRGRGGRKRGRRTAKSRQKLVKREAEIPGGTCIPKDNIFEESPLNLGTGDWIIGESPTIEVGVPENASSDGSDYDDDNGQTAEYEFDDLGAEDYANEFNGEKPEDLLEGSDYNEDEDEEDDRDLHDDDEGDDDEGDDDGDAEVDKYINGDSDEENGEEEGGGSMRGLPVGDTSSSSEYSD